MVREHFQNHASGLQGSMLRAFCNRLTLLAAMLILAATSVYSAGRMAPRPADHDAGATWVTAGTSHHDAGSMTGADHGDHCPFCHKLGATPSVVLSPRSRRITLAPVWQRLDDLRREPHHGHPDFSARAPPTLA